MEQFKVFYSWQSDLPGNTNRNFINACIEDAVENCNSFAEGKEVIADRDTKGMTGSPNISTAIFSKIDECDLFIADVSIVNSYKITEDDINEDGELEIEGGTAAGRPVDSKKPEFRYTPNPNVLMELGYAVKCLGWERVICFMNTDYGDPKKLPFDLDHQRVTPYSLVDENKTTVKKYLRSIVTDTILELLKKPAIKRKGKSYHVVGTYDSENKTIDADLVAYDVTKYSWIDEYNVEHKEKSSALIQKIKKYQILLHNNKTQKGEIEDDSSIAQYKKLQNAFGFNSDDNMIDCVISKVEQDSIKELAEKYLDMSSDSFDEVFFNLGDLKVQAMTPINPILGRIEPIKSGTDAEKEKYDKIHELHCCLIEMQQLDLYLKTFEDVLLFPLAIENESNEIDENIEVAVKVDGGEPITPSGDFINPDIRNVASIIYGTGFPRDLLVLQNDTNIKYDDDSNLYYNSEEPFYGTVLRGLPNQIRDKDYEYAMERYIATPISENNYMFDIDSLRANEKKWLGRIIAVRKVNEDAKIRMKYRIISNNTSGDIEGELIYRGDIR